MEKVKQINNLSIYKEKDKNYYEVYTPDGQRVFRSDDIKRVEECCKAHKEYLRINLAKRIKMCFKEHSEGYLYHCTFTVNKDITPEQLRSYITECVALFERVYMEDTGGVVRFNLDNVDKQKYKVAKEVAAELDIDTDTIACYFEYMKRVYNIVGVEDAPPAFTILI